MRTENENRELELRTENRMAKVAKKIIQLQWTPLQREMAAKAIEGMLVEV